MRNQFLALQAKQGAQHAVFCFTATAEEVLAIARIDRAGRDAQGDLFGFQRPQIAQHIQQIRDYLQRPDAVLPNSVVIALTNGIAVAERQDASSNSFSTSLTAQSLRSSTGSRGCRPSLHLEIDTLNSSSLA